MNDSHCDVNADVFVDVNSGCFDMAGTVEKDSELFYHFPPLTEMTLAATKYLPSEPSWTVYGCHVVSTAVWHRYVTKHSSAAVNLDYSASFIFFDTWCCIVKYLSACREFNFDGKHNHRLGSPVKR